MMKDFILIAILVAVIGGAAWYVYRAKKRGDTCVGCPHAKACGSKCGGNCNHESAKNYH